MPGGIELVELTPVECLRLLDGPIIGRVIFTDAAMPAAQPVTVVTFLLDGKDVVFRTRNGSKLCGN
jgi:hypothetical protein